MKRITLIVFFCHLVFAGFGQLSKALTFEDVWQLFYQPFSKTDSFLLQKGYKRQPGATEADKFVKTFTGPVINGNLYKVIISRAYYDSFTVTGVDLEADVQDMDSMEKDLSRHRFVAETAGYTLPGYAPDIHMQEWVSVKYFLVCSITFNYPKQWLCHLKFGWHDMLRGSLAVYKKENNPYLTPRLLHQYDTTEHIPYAENLSFSSFSDPPMFKGGARGLFTYLNNNVRYPAAALADSIEAVITVAYTVDEDGKLVKAEVTKGAEAGHGLPEEAVRLFMQTPLWRPGRERQNIVASSAAQTIVFKIRPPLGSFLK